MYRSTLVVLAVCLCTAISQSLAGQVDPDSIKHRNDCRLASQVLTLGQPATREGWALNIIVSCGNEGGVALSRTLERYQRSLNPSVMEPIVWAATRLRDASVYETALAMTSDPTASIAARVQAIRILSAQLDPQGGGASASYDYYAMSRTTEKGVGIDGLIATADDPIFTGRALPSDALSRAEHRMRRVAGDPHTPQPIRNAAATLLEEIGGYKICVGVTAAECRRLLEAVTESAAQ